MVNFVHLKKRNKRRSGTRPNGPYARNPNVLREKSARPEIAINLTRLVLPPEEVLE